MSEKILVFSEDPKKIIYPLGFAKLLKSKLNYKITAITLESEIINEILNKGVDEIKLLREKLTLEQYEEILKMEINKDVKYIIANASYNENDILARLAGLNDVYMITDVNDIEIEQDSITFKRKALGGRAIAKIKFPSNIQLFFTVSAKKIEFDIKSETKIDYLEAIPEGKLKIEKVDKKITSGVDITQAEIVIGVGRGFKSKEDLKLAEELASLIGAQIGSSRPVAADYKWIPEDRWIGISGKSIRPNLYFAIGISGAPQHIGGIQDSKIIVALDKDKNAPIFNYADYCIVADLYEFLPVLIKKIKERKSS